MATLAIRHTACLKGSEMKSATLMGLINNAALLLALGYLYDALPIDRRQGRWAGSQLLAGGFLGLLGVAVMMTPWEFLPGVVFDTRSVLLSISGLFFGAVPTLVAVVITAAFRVYSGGAGMWTGVAVIVTSGGMGLAWRRFRRSDLDKASYGELYLLGVAVHFAMLLWMFSLPWSTALSVLSAIGVPVMLIFPAATALLGGFMSARQARKEVEIALRERESFIKSVMDNLPIGIAVNSVDPVVKFEYTNDNFLKYYRATRESLADPDAFWTSVYEDPEFREVMKKRVVDDCASGDPERMQWTDVPIARSGEATSFISARNIPIPEKRLVISTVWDVTDRKRTEDALKDNERFLNEVGRIAKIGGWGMDLVTRQAWWTKGTYDIIGIEYGKPVPGPDEQIAYYLPEYRALVSEAMQALIEGDRPLDFEAQFRNTEGEVKWCRAIGQAKREEGRCVKVYGTLQDITDRKDAEEEIRKLNRNLELRVHQRTAQLKEAHKELEDFVYSVSHDLRAPLRSISGFAEIIDRRHKNSLNEEGRHYFENIVRASRQMGELIDDLLQFSRLGRKAIKAEKVPLGDVFKTAMETLSGQIMKTGARVRLPERLPAVEGDLTLVTHIFINLLENAIKYHQPDQPPCVDVGVAVQGRRTVVSIADNGIGIEPEYHEKIFDIFQRLHSQTDYPGTGIGLAAVKKAAQIMGGRVWVESEPGKGSVFKVEVSTAMTEQIGETHE